MIAILLPFFFSDCIPAEVKNINNCKYYASSYKIACKYREERKVYYCYTDLRNLKSFIKPNGKIRLEDLKCNLDPESEEFKSLEFKFKLPRFCLVCASF